MSQAAGSTREDDDFSQWTFTYTQDYQLIKLGANELTAKISCYDNGDLDLNPFPAAGAQTTSSSSPLSEWYTANVYGIVKYCPEVGDSSPYVSEILYLV